MNRQITKNRFLEAAEDWICDCYSLGIHYLAKVENNGTHIIDALIFLNPLPPDLIDNFSIKTGNLVAGREIFEFMNKTELVTFIKKATNGNIDIHGLQLVLPCDAELDYYSILPSRDLGFSELHLQVTGSRLPVISQYEISTIDDLLRMETPPFDGLADLCTWLQLSDLRTNGQASSVSLRVGPPIDLIFDETNVHENKLRLTLLAHSKFEISKITLSIKELPGQGIASRKHVTSLISWQQSGNDQTKGILELDLLNADSVFVMLMAGTRTVRRRVFDDPDKAVNSRYVATQLFDKDLKQLKSALTDTDSRKFEKGVASLLYLLGFSNAIQMETQAPDILVTSPDGRMAIIECTTKISDFQNKLGKLVERRNALMATFEGIGNNLQVGAFLVCGLPKLQIAVEENQLIKHQVTLLCKEQISAAFDQLRMPTNPDRMLKQAAERLLEKQNSVSLNGN